MPVRVSAIDQIIAHNFGLNKALSHQQKRPLNAVTTLMSSLDLSAGRHTITQVVTPQENKEHLNAA